MVFDASYSFGGTLLQVAPCFCEQLDSPLRGLVGEELTPFYQAPEIGPNAKDSHPTIRQLRPSLTGWPRRVFFIE